MSLDVAIGAGCSSILFFFQTHHPVDLPTIVTLSLVVWIIYTFDHLIDAIKIPNTPVLPRHRFHKDHFKSLVGIWLVVVLITVILIYKFLYPITVYLGLIVAFLVFLHFIFLNLFSKRTSPLLQKELGIAFVYALGIALPAFSLSPFGFTCPILLTLFQVVLLAAVNLIEFSLFEVIEDTKEEQISIVRSIGTKSTALIIKGLFSLHFLIAILAILLDQSSKMVWSQLILILMGLTLLLIFWNQAIFRRNENYRIFGDLIFFLPGLLYFLL